MFVGIGFMCFVDPKVRVPAVSQAFPRGEVSQQHAFLFFSFEDSDSIPATGVVHIRCLQQGRFTRPQSNLCTKLAWLVASFSWYFAGWLPTLPKERILHLSQHPPPPPTGGGVEQPRSTRGCIARYFPKWHSQSRFVWNWSCLEPQKETSIHGYGFRYNVFDGEGTCCIHFNGGGVHVKACCIHLSRKFVRIWRTRPQSQWASNFGCILPYRVLSWCRNNST